MGDAEQWKDFVDKATTKNTVAPLRKFLSYCIPHKLDRTIIIGVPNTVFVNLLQTELSDLIRTEFDVQGIQFVEDPDAKQRYLAQQHSFVSPQVPPSSTPSKPTRQPLTIRPYQPTGAQGSGCSDFSILDNLRRENREKPLPTAGNATAYRAIDDALRDFPFCRSQPIMIWGDIGQGKTHLLQYFAWKLIDKIHLANKEKRDFAAEDEEFGEDSRRKAAAAQTSRIRYITAEQATDEHKKTHHDAWEKHADAESYNRNRTNWYEGIDALFIDDLHAFSKGSKESTIEWMYKVVNDHMLRNAPVISAIDCNPLELEALFKKERTKKEKELAHDFERLFSRLRSGLLIQLGDPTPDELKVVVNTYLSHSNAATYLDEHQFADRITTMRNAVALANNIAAHAKDKPLDSVVKYCMEQFPLPVFIPAKKKGLF